MFDETKSSKQFRLISLIDLVFILNLFFLVTISLSVGQEVVLGEKIIKTPQLAGETEANMVLQIYKTPSDFRFILIGPNHNRNFLAARTQISNKNISSDNRTGILTVIDDKLLTADNRNQVKQFIIEAAKNEVKSPGGIAEILIVIRSEYDIPYHVVLQMMDLFNSSEIQNIVNISYVLRVGGIESTKIGPGLMDELIFNPPKKPPREVKWFTPPDLLKS